jgi:hypothetical protein
MAPTPWGRGLWRAETAAGAAEAKRVAAIPVPILLTRLSVYERVDDLCKKGSKLVGSRIMLGIAVGADALVTSATWEDALSPCA